jgi:hypothetical protein
VNGCQQGIRSVASFGFGGQECASKPPQSHMQNVGSKQKLNKYIRLENFDFENTPAFITWNIFWINFL